VTVSMRQRFVSSIAHTRTAVSVVIHPVRLRRTLVAGAAITLAVVFGTGVGGGTAEAAQPAMHCAVVLDKVHPGETASRVMSESCSTSATSVVPLASIPILSIWENINYTGASKTFYGGSGPCDAAGYIIRDVGDNGIHFAWWRTHVSSFMWGNNCSFVNAYKGGNNTGFCAMYHGNVGYVGAFMNDKIWSFHVQSAPRNC
jgi:hypothetical protein